ITCSDKPRSDPNGTKRGWLGNAWGDYWLVRDRPAFPRSCDDVARAHLDDLGGVGLLPIHKSARCPIARPLQPITFTQAKGSKGSGYENNQGSRGPPGTDS